MFPRLILFSHYLVIKVIKVIAMHPHGTAIRTQVWHTPLTEKPELEPLFSAAFHGVEIGTMSENASCSIITNLHILTTYNLDSN